MLVLDFFGTKTIILILVKPCLFDSTRILFRHLHFRVKIYLHRLVLFVTINEPGNIKYKYICDSRSHVVYNHETS